MEKFWYYQVKCKPSIIQWSNLGQKSAKNLFKKIFQGNQKKYALNEVADLLLGSQNRIPIR